MTKTIATLLAVTWLLVGCNTIRGFGQDLQRVGDTIEEKARR